MTTPVDAYVLSSLNNRSQGTRDYVDPKTYLTLRRERLDPHGTIVTTYDRYAKFGAQTLPAQWTVAGRRGSEIYERAERLTAPVTDADLGIPPIKRELLTFPPGGVREQLPVTTTRDVRIPERNDRFYVHVTIGPRTVDLVLSSAAVGIELEAATAHELGLTLFNRVRPVNDGDFETETAMVPSIKIGPLEMHDVAVDIMPRPLETWPGVAKAVG